MSRRAPHEVRHPLGPPRRGASRIPRVMRLDLASRPALSPRTRLRWDARARKHLLVYPERGLLLDEIATEIVVRCDGTRSIASIVAELSDRFGAPLDRVQSDVLGFLAQLVDRALLIESRDMHTPPLP